MKLLTKLTVKQFQKFVVIGLCTTTINYGIFFLLIKYAYLNHIIAASVAYVIGLFIGYLLNRSWTFQSANENRHSEFSCYLGLYLMSLVLSMLFLGFLVSVAYIDPLLANIFAISLSTTTNFLGTKLFVFRNIRT